MLQGELQYQHLTILVSINMLVRDSLSHPAPATYQIGGLIYVDMVNATNTVYIRVYRL